jgi:hypothetical protein
MPSIVRRLKNVAKTGLRQVFEVGQRLGVDILPHHFYSQIPTIAALRAANQWRAPLSFFGVQGIDIAEQSKFAGSVCAGSVFPEDLYSTAISVNGEGGGYGAIEAKFLFAFVVAKQPKRIIQIGCGVSTAIVLRAAKAAGYEPEITCIEPFPSPYLQQLHAAGTIRLRNEGAQVTPLSVFADLTVNDLLFVDSTHTVKPGSEVNRIVLEVLQRLNPGVWVHFHDIYFPYDYQRDLMEGVFFAAESTLLHAFLTGNTRYSIAASLSMLHYAAPEVLQQALPGYVPEGNHDGLRKDPVGYFPSAIYLRVGA